MADITMCSNKLCPLAGCCYRAQATPSGLRQSMGFFQYEVGVGGISCNEFIPMYSYSASNNTKEQPNDN